MKESLTFQIIPAKLAKKTTDRKKNKAVSFIEKEFMAETTFCLKETNVSLFRKLVTEKEIFS